MRLLQNDTLRVGLIVLAFILGFLLTAAVFLHPHKVVGAPISLDSAPAGQVSK